MPIDVSPVAAPILSHVTAGRSQLEQTVTPAGSSFVIRVWRPQSVLRRDFHAPTEVDRLKFQLLANQWREQTRALSSDSDIVANFAYHQIMGMGERALPLIFNEMRAHGGRWFWALRAITGENPVRPEDRGN